MAWSSAEINLTRDAKYTRLVNGTSYGTARLVDDGGTTRFSVQTGNGATVTKIDGGLQIAFQLQTSDANGYNLVKLELWSNDGTPALMADWPVTIDRRSGMPANGSNMPIFVALSFLS